MGSSLWPPKVTMELHLRNREKLLTSLRQHLSLSSRPLHGFVLLQGGEEQIRHDTDHIELFRQESYFAYLFGVNEPGFYGAIDLGTGDSILFAPRLPAEYAVWLGEIKSLFYYKGIDKFDKDLTTLHPILTECRVIKSDLEIALIQYANDISSEAHVEVMRKTKVGMKEYQLESTFLHHTYMYGGCRHCSYTCICATGENSAVLHYGHAAAPNDKTLEDGDMALFDMGAEYHFYGSDITCSFPVNGKFTIDQSFIYSAVLDAHNAVISAMKPGVNWVDMHILAEKVILESLKKGHVILGDVDDMMADRLGAVFMPHGLGHFLGIDTHDPGGYLKDLERRKEPGLKALRTIRDLREGMVITVEPGCYFIDALLLPAMNSPETSRFLNQEVINRFKGFGGVRIESDVLVTAAGCYNMTKCPREIWEIEAVMAGAPWPAKKISAHV
ncbi:xaa-Pro dipeptidase isoform X2 [Abrus precatorius]|uniref:Xaa-Pro dipeptidase n=1 Tax=Abrus precatorius TaxID=3816 RepID=A0A8B8KDF6_ABRPR|nr:xaa-Pro dipeptidase isoform X2 [Abrus precatorius]